MRRCVARVLQQADAVGAHRRRTRLPGGGGRWVGRRVGGREKECACGVCVTGFASKAKSGVSNMISCGDVVEGGAGAAGGVGGAGGNGNIRENVGAGGAGGVCGAGSNGNKCS